MPSKGAKGSTATALRLVVSPPMLNSIRRSAERLDISKASLYELIRNDRVTIAKFGSRTLIAERELQRVADDIEAGKFAGAKLRAGSK